MRHLSVSYLADPGAASTSEDHGLPKVVLERHIERITALAELIGHIEIDGAKEIAAAVNNESSELAPVV